MLLLSRYLSPVDLSCLALCNHRFMTFSFAGSFKNLLGQVGIRGPSEEPTYRSFNQAWSQFTPILPLLGLPATTPLEICGITISTLQKSGLLLRTRHSFISFGFSHVPYLLYLQVPFRPSLSCDEETLLRPIFWDSTDSLLYTEVSRALLDSRNPNSPRRTGLMSIDARICLNPSSLCLRIQNITVAKRQDLQPLFRSTSDKYDYRYSDNIAVCEHIDPTDTVKLLIGNYCRQGERGNRQFSNQGKCNQCNTSWNMEPRELEEQDICFAFTLWKDLGSGLDPEDDRWKTHLFQNHPKTVRKSEMLDDPRTRFEMISEGCSLLQAMPMEEMFRHNMALLKGRRYRAVMRYWGGWWYLQGEERKTRYPQCTIVWNKRYCWYLLLP